MCIKITKFKTITIISQVQKIFFMTPITGKSLDVWKKVFKSRIFHLSQMTAPETACISPKRALSSELFPLPTGPTMRVKWPFLKTIFWLMCKLGGSSLLQAKELPSLSETAASRGPVWRWDVVTNAGSPSSSSSSSCMFPKPTGPKTLSLLSQRPEGGRAYQIFSLKVWISMLILN